MIFNKGLALFLLLVIFILASCGQDVDEKRAEAIFRANIMLSSGNYEGAITLLESVGRDYKNVSYLQTLASAYAGRAGFDEPTFFADDLPSLALGVASPLTAFTRFTKASSMNAPDNYYYESLQTAIDLLLYAGGTRSGTNPTAARRQAILGATAATNINIQLLFMLMSQLGRYLAYYGNVNAAGVKGAGTGTNGCIVNYDLAAVNTYLTAGNPGASCTDATVPGHPMLGPDAGLNIPRLCQGVILFNNLLDVMDAVVDAVGTAIDDFSVLNATFANAIKLTLGGYGGTEAIMAVQDQALCEDENTADDSYIQLYFGIIFETLLK